MLKRAAKDGSVPPKQVFKALRTLEGAKVQVRLPLYNLLLWASWPCLRAPAVQGSRCPSGAPLSGAKPGCCRRWRRWTAAAPAAHPARQRLAQCSHPRHCCCHCTLFCLQPENWDAVVGGPPAHRWRLVFAASAKVVAAANKGQGEGGGFYFPLPGEARERCAGLVNQGERSAQLHRPAAMHSGPLADVAVRAMRPPQQRLALLPNAPHRPCYCSLPAV